MKNTVNLNIAQFKVDWVIFRAVSGNLLRLSKKYAPVNQKLEYLYYILGVLIGRIRYKIIVIGFGMKIIIIEIFIMG